MMKLHKGLLLFGASALFLTACGGDDVENESVEEPEVEEVAEEPAEEETELPEELQDIHISDVRDDTTGNWKKAVESQNFNMPENAITYYDEYMEEDEIHYLISFATNTTTMISNISNTLYVDITEYEDREEHSADTIGGGMLLKSYAVYLDTGETEEF